MMSRPVSIGAKLLLVTGCLTLLAGCGDSHRRELEQYAEEIKARKPGRIEPLPEIKQIETFTYVAGNRRNPFRPEQPRDEMDPGAVSTTDLAPDRTRRKEELESFSLDSIRMVGTLQDSDDTIWGLVRTSDRILFRVKAGNYMGRNHGQITKISENSIELTEIVSDNSGGYQERQASIALSE
jgi:type IV pilus assembly protein PilP